jgi:DNA-binding transcriptional ArsR family regulator
MEVFVIGPSMRLGQNFNPGTSNNGHAAALPAIGHPGRDGAALHAAPPAGGGRSPNPPPPRREPTPSGDVCRLLSLLADKTRLRILKILAEGERPVVALTAELRLPQPTVSHHLAWLRMMDLVSPRRQGKHVYYSLGPAAQWEENGVLTLTADDATVTITPNRPA